MLSGVSKQPSPDYKREFNFFSSWWTLFKKKIFYFKLLIQDYFILYCTQILSIMTQHLMNIHRYRNHFIQQLQKMKQLKLLFQRFDAAVAAM